MVDPWWSLLGAAIPAVIMGQALRLKKRRAEEQRLKSARGREKSSDDIFVCERVCTSKRMLKKVGSLSKDPTIDTCVTVCGVSEIDACADACARTVCVNQHQVPNWNDICLRKCQSAHQLVSEEFRSMGKIQQVIEFYDDFEKLLASERLILNRSFPVFFGGDLRGWVEEIERCLDGNGVPVEYWFSVAVEWMQIWREIKPCQSWLDLKEMVLKDTVAEKIRPQLFPEKSLVAEKEVVVSAMVAEEELVPVEEEEDQDLEKEEEKVAAKFVVAEQIWNQEVEVEDEADVNFWSPKKQKSEEGSDEKMEKVEERGEIEAAAIIAEEIGEEISLEKKRHDGEEEVRNWARIKDNPQPKMKLKMANVAETRNPMIVILEPTYVSPTRKQLMQNPNSLHQNVIYPFLLNQISLNPDPLFIIPNPLTYDRNPQPKFFNPNPNQQPKSQNTTHPLPINHKPTTQAPTKREVELLTADQAIPTTVQTTSSTVEHPPFRESRTTATPKQTTMPASHAHKEQVHISFISFGVPCFMLISKDVGLARRPSKLRVAKWNGSPHKGQAVGDGTLLLRGINAGLPNMDFKVYHEFQCDHFQFAEIVALEEHPSSGKKICPFDLGGNIYIVPLWPSANKTREGILGIWDFANIVKYTEDFSGRVQGLKKEVLLRDVVRCVNACVLDKKVGSIDANLVYIFDGDAHLGGDDWDNRPMKHKNGTRGIPRVLRRKRTYCDDMQGLAGGGVVLHLEDKVKLKEGRIDRTLDIQEYSNTYRMQCRGIIVRQFVEESVSEWL